MYVIGLTGGIGSGKSAVTTMFEQLGIDVIDADIASRAVVAKGKPALAQIAQHFGGKILQQDGTLDRSALRKIVFSQAEQRGWLERLLFPLIFREIQKMLKQANGPYAVLVSPLLVETGQNRLTNRILVIDAPEELQLARAVARDNSDEGQIRAIMATQATRERRLQQADDVIVNDKSLDELNAAVKTLHKRYLQLAAQV